MKVFLVFTSVPYEGMYFKEGFTTLEKAQAYADRLEAKLREDDCDGRDPRHFDHAIVKEVELDLTCVIVWDNDCEWNQCGWTCTAHDKQLFGNNYNQRPTRCDHDE